MSQEHYEEKNSMSSFSNKLDVEVAPKQLQNLRKLQTVLVSKTILFKKAAIMHRKG